MFQPPQNTGMTQSMGSVAQSVPKISHMMVNVDKALILPKKIHITINDPITVKAPKLITDGKEKKEKATKSESAAMIKTKERWKKAEDKENKWKKSVKKWQEGLLGTLTKTLTDNPITNFIKDHWGKLLIGLGFLFLKPSQMKAVWEALKGMATWLWKNGPGIFKGIYDGLAWLVPKIGKLIGGIFKWLFGESEQDREQDKLDEMKKEGSGASAEDIAKQEAKVRVAGTERTGGLDDSLFKQVAFGLGGLILLLKKLGPDGIVGKMFSKMGKTLFDKVIRNNVMEDKVKGYLTDDMMKMDRGKKLSMMDKFRNNDYVKYGKDKASKVGGAVKAGASKVGGAVKNVASAGGDWFKSLMGKFGKAGKFLAKMGKSVIQGLMTMGPYGWAILGGIALGGLVWYFWDDITRVWDNIAGTISKGFTKVKEMVTGMFGNVQGMLGGWLRGIGAGMIADWIDPDGADPEKPKEEFSWGGFMGELWAVYSGIWKEIIGRVKKLASSIGSLVLKFAKAVGVPEWITDMFDASDEPPKKPFKFSMTDEEMANTPGLQEKAQTQWSSFEKTEEGKEYLKNFQDQKSIDKAKRLGKEYKGAVTSKAKDRARAAWEAQDSKRSAVSTASKVIATPTTPTTISSGGKKFLKEIRKDIKRASRWRGKDRRIRAKKINDKIDASEYGDEILEKLTPRQLKIIGRDGLATKKIEERKIRRAAKTPEQIEADDKKLDASGGITAGDAFAGDPSPMVSPTMKADTLNQVQGENAELSSGTNAIVAPTTINNITNNYGNGGEGGTAIYGVPTAQKGTKVKHSNIR